MKKILVKGNLNKPKVNVYRAKCSKCGCVFEFEDEDIKSQERHPGGKKIVECPYCHTDVVKTSFNNHSKFKSIEE